MDNRSDAAVCTKDSTPTKATARQDALAFVKALLEFPINFGFSLWNLQGAWNARLSGKVPAELDFAREIELAKQMGWLEEREEDVGSTRRYQRMYKNRPIRYGRTFTRTARSTMIKAQREQFISRFLAEEKSGATT